MALDQTTFAFALKQYYTPQKVDSMTYAKNPLFALMPKDTEWVGGVQPVPVDYTTTQARSTNIGTAIGITSSTKGVAFQLSRIHDFAIALIANETIKATQNNSGAFVKAST